MTQRKLLQIMFDNDALQLKAAGEMFFHFNNAFGLSPDAMMEVVRTKFPNEYTREQETVIMFHYQVLKTQHELLAGAPNDRVKKRQMHEQNIANLAVFYETGLIGR